MYTCQQLAKSRSYLPTSITLLALVVVVLAAFPERLAAQTYQVLYSFSGGDGGRPYGGLLRDSNGSIYGTTLTGGPRNSPGCFGFGCGVAFKLDAAGKETVLYAFKGQANGAGPDVGLVRDSQGNLYGTTDIGGDIGCNAPAGCGTIFEIDAAGQETVLHNFQGGKMARSLWGRWCAIQQATFMAQPGKEGRRIAERYLSWMPQATRPCCLPLTERPTEAGRWEGWCAIRKAIYTALRNSAVI